MARKRCVVNPDHLELVTRGENVRRAWERSVAHRRRRLNERDVLRVLIMQGIVIPCDICKAPLTLEDVQYAERDHFRARHTFPDDQIHLWESLENQRYVHGLKDPIHPCHRIKTDGMRHNHAGSDKHMAAKGRRLRGETKQGPKAKIRSRNTLSKEYRDQVREKYKR